MSLRCTVPRLDQSVPRDRGNQTSQANREFSSRDAYGTLVRITAGETELLREHRCGEGLAAQNSATMLVGIGAHEQADAVNIRWPSGKMQRLDGLAAGSLATAAAVAAVALATWLWLAWADPLVEIFSQVEVVMRDGNFY